MMGSTALTIAMIAIMVVMMGGMIAGTLWAVVRRRHGPRPPHDRAGSGSRE
jgi:hypothetical protein